MAVKRLHNVMQFQTHKTVTCRMKLNEKLVRAASSGIAEVSDVVAHSG